MRVMVGQKIRSARILAGLSLRELSKKTGISKAKVDLLRTRVDKKLIPRLDIEWMLGLGLDPKHSTIQNNLVIRNGEDAEEAAEMLRTGWEAGKGGIISVTELLEDHGIRIFAEDLSWDFDGMAGWVSGSVPLIAVNIKSDPELLRIIILRELGHLVLKFDTSLQEIEKEQLCMRFSNAFLVSRETFFREVGKKSHLISTPELVRMSETYGIPVKSLMHRARVLDVINQNDYHAFQMRISINPSCNGLGWFSGRERFDRYKILVFKAFSLGLIPLDQAAARLGMPPLQFKMESQIL